MTGPHFNLQGTLLTIVLGATMVLGTCSANTLSTRQDRVEDRLTVQERLSVARGERLATLEAQAAQNNKDHEEIKELLRRVIDLQIKAAKRLN